MSLIQPDTDMSRGNKDIDTNIDDCLKLGRSDNPKPALILSVLISLGWGH